MAYVWIVLALFVVGCKKDEKPAKEPEAPAPIAAKLPTETEEELQTKIEELEEANDLKGAAEAARKLVGIVRSRGSNDEESLEWALYSYGRALYMAGEPVRAERALREGLSTGKSDELRAALYYQLGGVLNAQDRASDAVVAHRESHELYAKFKGEESDEALDALEALAGSYDHAGQYKEAEAVFRRLIKVREPREAEDPHSLGYAVVNLAGSLDLQERLDEALVQYKRAAKLLKTTVGYERRVLAKAHAGIAGVAYDRGKYGEAEREYRKALAMNVEALGPDHPTVAFEHYNLALVLEMTERYEEAVVECKRAQAIRRGKLDDKSELLVQTDELCARLEELK